MNNFEHKIETETRLFQSFVNGLFNTTEYCNLFQNIHDIKREESPDFEMITKVPEDVFIYKCNQALKESNHPFSKVFLFCGEKGNSWICGSRSGTFFNSERP